MSFNELHKTTDFATAFAGLLEKRELDEVPHVRTRRVDRDVIYNSLVAAYGPPGSDVIMREGLEALVEQTLAECAADRHESRVLSCVARMGRAVDVALEAHVLAGFDRESIATDELGIVAERKAIELLLGLVALRGQGGTQDLGGPGGASSLPVFPWIRTHTAWGPAWVSALREAVSRLVKSEGWEQLELLVAYGDVNLRLGGDLYELERGLVHPGVWRLIADPSGLAVDGMPLPIAVSVPPHGKAGEVFGREANHPYELALLRSLGARGLIHRLDGIMSDASKEAA